MEVLVSFLDVRELGAQLVLNLPKFIKDWIGVPRPGRTVRRNSSAKSVEHLSLR